MADIVAQENIAVAALARVGGLPPPTLQAWRIEDIPVPFFPVATTTFILQVMQAPQEAAELCS